MGIPAPSQPLRLVAENRIPAAPTKITKCWPDGVALRGEVDGGTWNM